MDVPVGRHGEESHPHIPGLSGEKTGEKKLKLFKEMSVNHVNLCKIVPTGREAEGP